MCHFLCLCLRSKRSVLQLKCDDSLHPVLPALALSLPLSLAVGVWIFKCCWSELHAVSSPAVRTHWDLEQHSEYLGGFFVYFYMGSDYLFSSCVASPALGKFACWESRAADFLRQLLNEWWICSRNMFVKKVLSVLFISNSNHIFSSCFSV